MYHLSIQNLPPFDQPDEDILLEIFCHKKMTPTEVDIVYYKDKRSGKLGRPTVYADDIDKSIIIPEKGPGETQSPVQIHIYSDVDPLSSYQTDPASPLLLFKATLNPPKGRKCLLRSKAVLGPGLTHRIAVDLAVPRTPVNLEIQISDFIKPTPYVPTEVVAIILRHAYSTENSQAVRDYVSHRQTSRTFASVAQEAFFTASQSLSDPRSFRKALQHDLPYRFKHISTRVLPRSTPVNDISQLIGLSSHNLISLTLDRELHLSPTFPRLVSLTINIKYPASDTFLSALELISQSPTIEEFIFYQADSWDTSYNGQPAVSHIKNITLGFLDRSNTQAVSHLLHLALPRHLRILLPMLNPRVDFNQLMTPIVKRNLQRLDLSNNHEHEFSYSWSVAMWDTAPANSVLANIDVVVLSPHQIFLAKVSPVGRSLVLRGRLNRASQRLYLGLLERVRGCWGSVSDEVIYFSAGCLSVNGVTLMTL